MNHLIFIGQVVGIDTLSPDDKRILQKFGVDLESITTDYSDLEQSFYWGRLSQALQQYSHKVGYNDFKEYLRRGQYIPLNTTEQYALKYIKQVSYAHIKGLGDRIKQDVNGIITENDPLLRSSYEEVIRSSAERTIIERDSLQNMVLEIGHRTGDWQRDLGRIADTELQNAYQYGRAEQIKRESGGDQLVYKNVFEGACRHCIRLYLTDGIGSQPILFSLKDLQANGTNIGLKTKEWVATLGTIHPWCFTNKGTRIFTSKGWVKIIDIKVGDLVLTHKGRFRKVTELIRTKRKRNDIEIYDLKAEFNGFKCNIFGITGDHPIYSKGEWVKTKEIKIGDKVGVMTTDCDNKECENKKLVKNTFGVSLSCCSISCVNKISSILQWQKEGMKEKMSISVSKGNYKRFAKSTIEDRRNLTQKARKVCDEKYPNHTSNFFSTESKNKAQKTNAKKATFIERKLRFFLDKLGVKYEVAKSLRIDDKKSNGQYKHYFPDIFIPSLGMIIEADGINWHDTEKDKIRDEKIKSIYGYDTFRFTEDEIRNNGDIVYEELERLIKNHKGEYILDDGVIVDKFKKPISKLNTAVTLYNFSVEEDESYVAEGLVVHNCRCQLHSLPKGYVWDEENEMFSPPKIESEKRKPLGIVVHVGDKTFNV
jgi:very-short-patch-repair endonuclease